VSFCDREQDQSGYDVEGREGGEEGGKDTNDASQGQERARSLGSGDLKVGLLEFPTGSEEGAAEDEEEVGEDGAEHRGLHDPELIVDESDDADDGFDGVCERRERPRREHGGSFIQFVCPGLLPKVAFRRPARGR
jgi:hypothetical protein